jgi:hypothetical protein
MCLALDMCITATLAQTCLYFLYSLDRNLLEYICESGDWEGTVTAAVKHRQYRACRFPDIGLTLSISVSLLRM